MAIAGPLTLDAAPLTVSTTPPLPAPFWLAVLRLELLDDDFRAAGLREEEDFRAPLLLEREDDERLLAAVLLPDAFVERLREAALLDLLLDPEDPLDARLVRAPLELALVAILSSPFENVRPVTKAYPTRRGNSRLQQVIQKRP
jgi:hypothetical protein